MSNEMVNAQSVILPWLIEQAEKAFNSGDGIAKKAWVVNQIVVLFESVDDKIPVVGRYLDTPFADKMEVLLVSNLVQIAFDNSPFAKK